MMKAAYIAAAAMLLLGCSTAAPKWEQRIGIYTYNNSLAELGPPDRLAKLSNGSTVAEWMTSPGFYHSPTYTQGYGSRPPYFGRVPAGFLRLTFDPHGSLISWKKIRR